MWKRNGKMRKKKKNNARRTTVGILYRNELNGTDKNVSRHYCFLDSSAQVKLNILFLYTKLNVITTRVYDNYLIK